MEASRYPDGVKNDYKHKFIRRHFANLTPYVVTITFDEPNGQEPLTMWPGDTLALTGKKERMVKDVFTHLTEFRNRAEAKAAAERCVKEMEKGQKK